MKCLILGASGQVGGQLALRCKADGLSWLGTAFRQQRFGHYTLDLRDTGAVDDLLHVFRPDLVFLPAAMTHVDWAETHPEECRAVNVQGTATLGRTVRDIGARLVFFSTDHVFGECDQPAIEDDATHPLSVYAQSKLEAEERIRDLLPDAHVIVRTSWVFGPEEQGKNFVYRAVRMLRAGQPLIVPADQYGQPTYAPDLARAALDLGRGKVCGTFHVVGPMHLTRVDYARLIANIFDCDPGMIVDKPTEVLDQAAPRPRRVWLSDEKIRRQLGRKPVRPPEAALRLLRDTIFRNTEPRSAVA